MKKNKFVYILILTMIMLTACKKEEVKPFGAVDIDYEAVERINSDGPTLSADRNDFDPPMAERNQKENGPWATQSSEEVFPYFEGDGTINEGDVPINIEEKG